MKITTILFDLGGTLLLMDNDDFYETEFDQAKEYCGLNIKTSKAVKRIPTTHR